MNVLCETANLFLGLILMNLFYCKMGDQHCNHMTFLHGMCNF